MAQSKSFFGLRRGSTKTLTFSVYNGKQVTKDRVYNVKNPRSSMQMKQRAIMATALHGYSALKEICNHSFEGITYGQKSMNYFVAENARMLRAAAPNVNLSTYKGISVSNAYIIAKGSLNPINIEASVASSKAKFRIMLPLSKNFTTFGDIMSAFGATIVGDMVTFVNLVSDTPTTSAVAYWLRLKLTETNKSIELGKQDGVDLNIMGLLTEGVDFETNIDNFTANDFPIFFHAETSQKALWIGNEETNMENPLIQSMGAIISRKSDTTWLRSSSTMVNLFDKFNYTEALASYPESGEKILNGGNM